MKRPFCACRNVGVRLLMCGRGFSASPQRLFCGVKRAFPQGEKGSSALRKSLFGTVEMTVLSAASVQVAVCQTHPRVAQNPRICSRLFFLARKQRYFRVDVLPIYLFIHHLSMLSDRVSGTSAGRRRSTNLGVRRLKYLLYKLKETICILQIIS